jgi:integrase
MKSSCKLRAFLARRNLDAEDKAFELLLRPRRQFKRDLEAVGIPLKDAEGRIVDFHSLRYTFCTNLQRLNVPQRVLMLLMQHSDRRLSERIFRGQSKRDEVLFEMLHNLLHTVGKYFSLDRQPWKSSPLKT